MLRITTNRGRCPAAPGGGSRRDPGRPTQAAPARDYRCRTRHPNTRGADRRPNWHRQSSRTRRRGSAPGPNNGPHRRRPRGLDRRRRTTRASRGRWPCGRDRCLTLAPSSHDGRPSHRCGGHARRFSDPRGRDGGQRHRRPNGAPTRRQGCSRQRRSGLRDPKCPSHRRAPRRRHPFGPLHKGPTRRNPQGSTRPNRGDQRRSHRDLRHLPPTRPLRGPGDRACPQGAQTRGTWRAPPQHQGKRRSRQGRHAPCQRDAAFARRKQPTRLPPPPTAGRHPGRTRKSRPAPSRAPPLRVAPAARRPRAAAPPAGPPTGLPKTTGRSGLQRSGIADQQRFELGGAAMLGAYRLGSWWFGNRSYTASQGAALIKATYSSRASATELSPGARSPTENCSVTA